MKTTQFIPIALMLLFLFQSCKEENNFSLFSTKNEVNIILKNRSGKKINSVLLQHEKGTKKYFSLTNNTNTTITFNTPGENAYTITATFDDGKKVKSKETYIESGYKMIETIHKDTIVTKHAIW